jgi:heme/copper-type cytochrome/quinol oxidase subunit 1
VPLLTRAFVKSGLICLGLALALGILIEAPPLPGLPSQLSVLFPTWIHLLVVGWLTQLIFGVAYWMFPRESAGSPRGSERLGWFTFGALTAGLLLRVIGEPMVSFGAGGGWLLVASAALQLAAGLGFIANTWPRIKAR